MTQSNRPESLPLENIIHRTASRPFSLYRTVPEPDERCALYLHCHPEAEIFYLEQGRLRFQIENNTFLLNEGEGIFIPPNMIHSAENLTVAPSPCSYRAVVFSPDMLERHLPAYSQTYFLPLQLRPLDCSYPITRDKAENAGLLALLPHIFSFHGMPLEQCELALTGTLFLCWQELYNLCFSALNTTVSQNTFQDSLRLSLDYIHEHFADQLSLKALADVSGFSEGYFCHSFKAYTGYTPFEYLNRVRVIKSCELLTGTDKKITEIAILCGFNNISYYNRTFYKTMNTTPSGYRKTLASTPSQ